MPENIMNHLPAEIEKMVAGLEYSMDEIGESDSAVIMFDDMVLKIQLDSKEVQGELEILKWLKGKLPVPEILCHVVKKGKSYLLMSKMEGQMACEESYLDNQRVLTSILAQAMKKLWETDISECPVRMDLDVKLSMAKYNVENNLVDIANTQPETFGENGFQDPQELLEWLNANRPEEELVLSHGDFCLPNIFIKDNKFSGFIDLGRAGAADKWLDIAICYRSLKHNYVGKYAAKIYEDFDPNMLFEELGIEPDWEKIKYYILLDELF